MTILDIRFFYIEAITFLVFFALFLRLGGAFRNSKEIFPKYTLLLIFWLMVSFLVGLKYGTSLRVIAGEFRNFISIIPIFYITYVGVKYLKIRFSVITGIFLFSIILLSLGSIFPYFFPQSVMSLLPKSLISGDSVLLDVKIHSIVQKGGLIFRRGTGSLWGSLLLSAYLLLLFFPVYTRKNSIRRDNPRKIVYLSACVLAVIVIVTTGHRSTWVGFLFGLGLLFIMKGLVKGVIYGAAAITALIIILPPSVMARFLTIFDVSDKSWVGRVTYYKDAFETMMQNPVLGIGLGSSGWVHNAILQIGANSGIIGISIFLLWSASLRDGSPHRGNSLFWRELFLRAYWFA